MRHFNYFPNGGPFPGVCAMCGIDRDLWQMGFEHFRGGDAMACSRCIGELAENIGWLPAQPFRDAIANRDAIIEDLTARLARIPNHTEGLINGVRNLVTDFVFAISNSSDTDSDSPVQGTDGSIEPDVEGDESADISLEAHLESFGIKGPDDVPAAPGRGKPGRPRKS